MAATTTVCSFFPALSSFPKFTPRKPSNFLLRATSFKPIAISSLKFARAVPVLRKREFRSLAISEAESGDSSKQEAVIDLKLPRRSLSVEFTCDDCGERTKRLINRLAYERGVVYVQCAGCEQYHKLVDNLGIVVEYKFRDENADKDEEA